MTGRDDLTPAVRGRLSISLKDFVPMILCLSILLQGCGMGNVKNDCVCSYMTEKNQTVVTVGTIHGNHLHRKNGYSLADIQSLVEYVDPDFIFIESRPETFERYGTIDGPIEMIFLYSYCMENGVGVRMIDWWEENDETKTNSTTKLRDDHMFRNICEGLEEVGPDRKVMVFYGTKHFYVQKDRNRNQGWRKIDFGNPMDYYKGAVDFVYPKSMADEIDRKIFYLSDIEPRIVEERIRREKTRKDFMDSTAYSVKLLESVKGLMESGGLFLD